MPASNGCRGDAPSAAAGQDATVQVQVATMANEVVFGPVAMPRGATVGSVKESIVAKLSGVGGKPCMVHLLQGSLELQDQDFLQRIAVPRRDAPSPSLLELTAVVVEFAPLSDEQRQEFSRALAVTQEVRAAFSRFPAEARADLQLAAEAARIHVGSLEHAHSTILANADFMTEMVRSNGHALQYAAQSLRADRRVVLEAVRAFGFSLRCASPAMRHDRAIVLEAVRRCGSALQYAGDALRSDREVAMLALSKHSIALQYVDKALLADRSFVIEAAKNNRFALEHVPQPLCADKAVIMATAKSCLRALRYADSELMADRDFVVELVRRHPEALQYASCMLRADKKVVMEAVGKSAGALRYADESLQSDADVLALYEQVPNSNWRSTAADGKRRRLRVRDDVLVREAFPVGSRVEMQSVDDDIPMGSIGQVIGLRACPSDGLYVHVQFNLGSWPVHPSLIAPLPAAIPPPT